MPGAIKNVKDYRLAIVFESKQSKRLEVELFRDDKSRDARMLNLFKAGIYPKLATVNRT